MISQRSRYAQSTVSRLPARDGVTAVQAILPDKPVVREVQYTSYRWTANDRIDSVAASIYDDETAWWVIAQANPEILMWDEIPVGKIIRIPDV